MKKAKPVKKWFIGRLYNILIIVGMVVAGYLCGKIAVSKISTMDIYLRSYLIFHKGPFKYYAI